MVFASHSQVSPGIQRNWGMTSTYHGYNACAAGSYSWPTTSHQPRMGSSTCLGHRCVPPGYLGQGARARMIWMDERHNTPQEIWSPWFLGRCQMGIMGSTVPQDIFVCKLSLWIYLGLIESDFARHLVDMLWTHALAVLNELSILDNSSQWESGV